MDESISCNDYRLLISAYHDNELNQEEADQVENHLSACRNCALELSNIVNLSGLLKNYSARIESKTDLASTVISRVNNEESLSCNEVLEEISAYFDGELNLKLHYLVKDHLDGCDLCKAEFNRISKLSKHIQMSFSGTKVSDNVDLYTNIESHLDNISICNEINDLLSPYLDKELDHKDTIRVNEHILACKYCRRDYENLKETQQIVRDYLTRSAPDIGSNTYIMEKLDRAERRKILITSFAAIFVIAALSWFSIGTFESIVLENTYAYRGQPEVKRIYNPIYVKADSFLFKEAFATPPDGVISVLYENN